MRIHFPNAEHAEVSVTGNRLLIGSAVAGADTLNLPGLTAQHIAIDVDRVRGIWLQVIDGTDIWVNGRPIRERAQLRLGDSVSLGTLQLLVKPDSDFRETPPPADADAEPAAAGGRACLRATSGRYFGKSVPLLGHTSIGRDSSCDVVLDEPGISTRHAVIDNLPEGLHLRDLGSASGTQVNGVSVRSTVLQPGDQIAFEQHRFVVEAPGWQPVVRSASAAAPASSGNTQVQRRPPIPAPPLPAAGTPSQAELRRSSQLTNWILAIAALVTLVALGTVVFLSLNNAL